VPDASSSLTGPVTGEAQNGLRDSGGTQLDSFFRKRDAEPVRAFARESSRTLDRAVTVSIRFDHRHHARGRADALFDLVEVCSKVAEIYFSPGRPPGEKVLFRL